MRKALWLQLPQYGRPVAGDGLDLQLAEHKKTRYPAGRTAARVEQERIYQGEVREWIQLPQNRWCQVYLRLLGRRVPATQCHHYQGRRGSLLLYKPFWIPVSWEGRRWINDHRQRARELGLLCPLGRYNSPVQLDDPKKGLAE